MAIMMPERKPSVLAKIIQPAATIAGAGIGTVIAPGAGTALGATLGGALGGVAGGVANKDAGGIVGNVANGVAGSAGALDRRLSASQDPAVKPYELPEDLRRKLLAMRSG